MPNIKSAKKRVKVAAKKTLQNRMIKSEIKTLTKNFDAAVQTADKANAAEAYKILVKKLDQAGSKNTFHKNFISRKKSQATRKLNGMA